MDVKPEVLAAFLLLRGLAAATDCKLASRTHTVGRGSSVHLVEGTAPNDRTRAEANRHQQPKKKIPAKPGGGDTALKSQKEVPSSHYTCPQPVVRH